MKTRVLNALRFAIKLLRAAVYVLSGKRLCKCGCEKDEAEIKETENK